MSADVMTETESSISSFIASHPDYPSLTLGVGASGHGYKHIPIIGGYIADCLEGVLDERMENGVQRQRSAGIGWEVAMRS
jgi:sarcosine oxidase/L-pipecolate oxidase